MASRGINKVILVGNCGQAPETKFMANGGAVTNVSIATSETWKDKQTGQPQERTEWHRVVFFNRLAEIVGEYVQKGSKLYIEGALRTRKWQDQNGQDRYTTEIVANEMQMLDSRGDRMGNDQQGGYAQTMAPAPSNQDMSGQGMGGQGMGGQGMNNQGFSQAAPAPSMGHTPPPAMDSFDDDIPF